MAKQKSEISKNEIILAGIKEIAKHGFRDITVRGICRVGGITNGRFFYYFTDKTDFILQAVSYSYSLLSDHIALWEMNIAEDLETNYVRLFEHWQDFWRKNPSMVFFFVETRINPPAELRYDFTDFRRKTFVATLRAKLHEVVTYFYPGDPKMQSFLIGVWLTVLDYVVLGLGLQKIDIYPNRESYLSSQNKMFHKILMAFLYGMGSEQFKAVLDT